MDSAWKINSYNQIKALSDAHRLDILRWLMAEPATLTHLAERLQHSPAWVRHHLLVLQEAGLVELIEIRKSKRVTEKYYHAKAPAFLIEQWVFPATDKPLVIFSGSHDLALRGLMELTAPHLQLIILPVGSLNGLIHLRQGICQISGTHIYDPQSGEYNLPTLMQLFPDRSIQVITLAQRVQGLIITAGNPKGIHQFADIARADIRFINRNEGSGTRLWLDHALAQLGIPPNNIIGYEQQLATHERTAQYVRSGKADVALGLQAAAFRYGLDFIPLFVERYDLVFPAQQQAALSPLLECLSSKPFRQYLNSLPGYDYSHSGEQKYTKGA